jgi:hypothetical protein
VGEIAEEENEAKEEEMRSMCDVGELRRRLRRFLSFTFAKTARIAFREARKGKGRKGWLANGGDGGYRIGTLT